MTDYNDGKWHAWNGGECPVHPKSKVKTFWENSPGAPYEIYEAGAMPWSHGEDEPNIVAFRVVKEYREQGGDA